MRVLIETATAAKGLVATFFTAMWTVLVAANLIVVDLRLGSDKHLKKESKRG